ncbi:hypothetical protein LWC05_08300 [Acetobacter sicerae]|uniref:Uncharacterized protein n=1 Tax=Acetobacter sicerae TaxID=85325 RepID=A0ABS8VY87_9PROT|nr:MULTISPECIES: hypothetical protein [Acetobacter]MCE0743887.1 hypothetical protein [Acetobacter sicerae]
MDNAAIGTGPFFMTESVVNEMAACGFRSTTGEAISYKSDLHPLFLKEMAFRYNLVDTGGSGMHARSSPTQDVIRAMSHILEGTCVSRVRGIKAYQKAAYDYIKGDIREALLGEFGSPIKSALEAVRYCRNTYRAFLENANFPASEHRTFLVEFLPAMQRSTYGPPISRNEELLALIDHGTVELIGGVCISAEVKPDTGKTNVSLFGSDIARTITADTYIVASCPVVDLSAHGEGVYRDLVRGGVLSMFYKGGLSIGGIDVDIDGSPRHSGPDNRIWVLGYPTEGSHFFTYALPHTTLYSRHQRDADICAAAVLRKLLP